MQYISQIHGGSGGSTGIDIIVPGQPITPGPPVTRPPVTRPPVTRPPITRPPVTRPPRPTVITLINTISIIKTGLMHINENSFVDLRSGGKISFRFRTLESKGILLFMRRKGATNQLFMAFEIFDGKLYFISDFASKTQRVLISDVMVNDGTWQNVILEVRGRQLYISFNGIQQVLDLTNTEVNGAYFNDGIYLGGMPSGFKSWYIWSDVSTFLGCFSDLKLENTSKFNTIYIIIKCLFTSRSR